MALHETHHLLLQVKVPLFPLVCGLSLFSILNSLNKTLFYLQTIWMKKSKINLFGVRKNLHM